jgi:hypothetical protein
MASFDEHTWLLTVRSLDARQLGVFMRACLETLLYQVRVPPQCEMMPGQFNIASL